MVDTAGATSASEEELERKSGVESDLEQNDSQQTNQIDDESDEESSASASESESEADHDLTSNSEGDSASFSETEDCEAKNTKTRGTPTADRRAITHITSTSEVPQHTDSGQTDRSQILSIQSLDALLSHAQKNSKNNGEHQLRVAPSRQKRRQDFKPSVTIKPYVEMGNRASRTQTEGLKNPRLEALANQGRVIRERTLTSKAAKKMAKGTSYRATFLACLMKLYPNLSDWNPHPSWTALQIMIFSLIHSYSEPTHANSRPITTLMTCANSHVLQSKLDW